MTVDAAGLRRKIGNYGERLGHEAVVTVARQLDVIAPVDTRQLRDSQQIIRLGRTSWRIWYPVEYASYPDTGTRPHVITPRNASVLRFQVGGRTVYAMKVDHPGNEGTGWFSDTVTLAAWKRALAGAKAKVAA